MSAEHRLVQIYNRRQLYWIVHTLSYHRIPPCDICCSKSWSTHMQTRTKKHMHAHKESRMSTRNMWHVTCMFISLQSSSTPFGMIMTKLLWEQRQITEISTKNITNRSFYLISTQWPLNFYALSAISQSSSVNWVFPSLGSDVNSLVCK